MRSKRSGRDQHLFRDHEKTGRKIQESQRNADRTKKYDDIL
jgi:hypothetical protein